MTTLSICIPTYNRGIKLERLVENLLTSNRVDLEVIVVDNQSTDCTQQRLSGILDSRFRYIRNTVPLAGMSNIINSLSYANGKFALLCLDKDRIDRQHLDAFMERLNVLPSNISFGQLAHNITASGISEFYEKGVDTLMAMGYNCAHPSGMFFRTDLLKESGIIKILGEKSPTFPFNPDIVKAHLAMLGGGCNMNIPLVFTETEIEAKEQKSFTYSGENTWFFPKNVVNQCMEFINDIQTLDLTGLQKKILSRKLCAENLYNATFRFKYFMSNDNLCEHHSVRSRRISKRELIDIYTLFVKNVPMEQDFATIKTKIGWWLRVLIKK